MSVTLFCSSELFLQNNGIEHSAEVDGHLVHVPSLESIHLSNIVDSRLLLFSIEVYVTVTTFVS
jgi:hypothetical protein